jgi:hypothetical protein
LKMPEKVGDTAGQRYFAVEFNNEAWALLESGDAGA